LYGGGIYSDYAFIPRFITDILFVIGIAETEIVVVDRGLTTQTFDLILNYEVADPIGSIERIVSNGAWVKRVNIPRSHNVCDWLVVKIKEVGEKSTSL